MVVVRLEGSSSISRLSDDRNLQDVPEAELVAVLVETLGIGRAEHLTRSLMERLGMPQMTPQNIIHAYCRLAAPRDYHDEV